MSNEEFKSQDAAAVAASEADAAESVSASAEAAEAVSTAETDAAVSAAGAADSAANGAGEAVSLVDEVTSGTDVLRLTEEQLAHLEQRPQSRDGFRLERVDVYNWSSFNNNVKSVYFGGQNVLMTGDNGAGKSSIIDAITVLLYDVRKVVFNQAAGAEKGERNLASYVLGLYKNDNTSGIKTELGLRSGQDAVLSVIMASFYHHQLQEYVVLLQCLVMQKNKSAPDRYYFIGNRDFNLQQDVLPVTNLRELSKKLKVLGMNRYEQFSEYYAQMQRLFGIGDTKVLDLFYKTISMKSINNISDFVRKQMLEDFNGDELVEQMIDRFDDLDASYKSVEEARQQVEALEPICRKGEEYQTVRAQVSFLEECAKGNTSYLYQRKADLIRVDIEHNTARLVELDQQIDKTREELDSLNERIQSTNNEILQQGGNRHELLKQNIRMAQKERERLFNDYTSYCNLLRHLQLEPVENEADFNRVVAKLDKLKQQLQNDMARADENRTQQNIELKTAQDEAARLDNEIRSLKHRKNNIPSEYIEARKRICEYIGCSEKYLPFAGELMQIKAEEKATWEYAVEKTLRSFALTMLVPETYFSSVVTYVNKSHLGILLRFDRIKDNDFGSMGSMANNTAMGDAFNKSGLARARSSFASLPRKIEIKNEAPFNAYIKGVLEHSFNFVCTEDEVEYRQERFALMPSGLCKRGGRNEKDDRRRRVDFILGWTNEEKIAMLQGELQRVREQVVSLQDAVRHLTAMYSENRSRLGSIDLLQSKKSFAQLDYFSRDREIAELKAELEELMRSSDVLKSLRQRLEEYEQDRKTLQNRRDSFMEERARIHERNANYEREFAMATDLGLPAKDIKTEVKAALDRLIADAQERLHFSALSVSNIDRVIAEVGERLDKEIRRLKAKEASLAQELVNLQSNFTQVFVLAGRNLDATRAAAWEGFKELLDKLQQDDLPRFVEAFKEKLNRETIDQFGSLNAVLLSQSRKIQERIADINLIMRDVDFNPDHYIQMVATPSKDQEICQFKSDMRTCTSNILDNDNWTFEEADRKFREVKALIDRFKGEVNGADIDGRWRKKVTDVKQWFEFSASEHARSDDSQVDYYEDSGGKSGGQKEKLAYTVLASSLAYQYQSKARAREEAAKAAQSAAQAGSIMPQADAAVTGAITSGLDHERSFRFVIIDEAFGRGSPQSVDYALTLFSKFNLQLLVATPMQKLDIIEKYVSHVAFVYRDEETHESTVVNYNLKDYILKRNLKERLQKVPLQQAKAVAAGGAAASAVAKLAAQEQQQARDAMAALDERIRAEQSKFTGPSQGPVHVSTPAPAGAASSGASSKASASSAASATLNSSGGASKAQGTTGTSEAAPAASPAPVVNQERERSDSLAAAKTVAGGLQIKGQDGKYLSVDEYAQKMQAERKAFKQKRTDAALSKLDFLDSLFVPEHAHEDQVSVATADTAAHVAVPDGSVATATPAAQAGTATPAVTAASAASVAQHATSTDLSSTADITADLAAAIEAQLLQPETKATEATEAKTKRNRKANKVEEMPRYKHSLDDLLLDED